MWLIPPDSFEGYDTPCTHQCHACGVMWADEASWYAEDVRDSPCWSCGQPGVKVFAVIPGGMCVGFRHTGEHGAPQ